VANALATQVLAGGDTGVAALRTALVHAGIGIIDIDSTVVDPPTKPSIGMNVQAGQLPLLVTLAQRGPATTLDEVVADWNDILDVQLPLVAARTHIAADYYAAATTARPATRQFYALFLDALGSANPNPNKLALDQDPTSVWLNGAQTFLMFLQWAHDDVAYRAAHHIPDLPTPSAGSAGAEPAGAAAGTTAPCTLGDNQKLITDPLSTGTSMVAGKFWSWISNVEKNPIGEGPVGNPDGLGKMEIFGIVLAIAQALATGAMFTGTMEMEGSPQLVRTTSTHQPGENRTLTLTLKYSIGKGQYANCVRYALNIFGQDASVPDGGAIKGAQIHWIMLNTGNSLDGPTQFYQVSGSSATDTTTDDTGTTQTGLQGAQQRVEIPENTPKVTKSVTVMAAVTVKPASLWNDILDSIGLPLAGFAAPVQIINNILQRTGTYDVTRTFSVQDWAKDFKIDANALYDNGFGHYPFEDIIKCAGIAGTWSNGHGFSFQLNKDGVGTIPTTDGPATITLILDGDGARLRFLSSGIQQEWPVIPGDWCNGDTPK
jgi:hypothetical protein